MKQWKQFRSKKLMYHYKSATFDINLAMFLFGLTSYWFFFSENDKRGSKQAQFVFLKYKTANENQGSNVIFIKLSNAIFFPFLFFHLGMQIRTYLASWFKKIAGNILAYFDIWPLILGHFNWIYLYMLPANW